MEPWLAMLLMSIRKTRTVQCASYDLCAHSLCTPPVMPSPLCMQAKQSVGRALAKLLGVAGTTYYKLKCKPKYQSQKSRLPRGYADIHEPNDCCYVHQSDVDAHGPVDALVLPVIRNRFCCVCHQGNRIERETPLMQVLLSESALDLLGFHHGRAHCLQWASNV
eukprot:7498-Heterococcus_DN1.PRE.2